MHPVTSSDEEMLRLLYFGIDGFVKLTERLEEQLLQSVRAILAGEFWVPLHVMREYVQQTNVLLDKQLRPNLSLTARETQVFQLMLRRLSNREIAGALGVSERTVKYHVSNIFGKLRVQNRDQLLATLNLASLLKPLTP